MQIPAKPRRFTSLTVIMVVISKHVGIKLGVVFGLILLQQYGLMLLRYGLQNELRHSCARIATSVTKIIILHAL